MNKIKILGAGHYVSKNKILNENFSEILDTSDEWIITRTGIKERYFSYDETTCSLAVKAAKNAIENAKINVEDIELVVVATITPDNFTPSVACSILKELGINRAMSFDINAACSGFIYALNTAVSLLNTNNLKKALIIGCEVISKILDYTDRSTAVLFGDGAGAVVIENKEKNCEFYCMAKTDEENVLYAKAVKSNSLFEKSSLNDNYLKMNGQKVFKFAINAMNESIIKILEKISMNIDDIDLIIPHQANIRIIQHVSQKLNIDINKFYINLDRYGNTSAASIAIALSECFEKKILKSGTKIILVGFGAGLTWSSMYLEI